MHDQTNHTIAMKLGQGIIEVLRMVCVEVRRKLRSTRLGGGERVRAIYPLPIGIHSKCMCVITFQTINLMSMKLSRLTKQIFYINEGVLRGNRVWGVNSGKGRKIGGGRGEVTQKKKNVLETSKENHI